MNSIQCKAFSTAITAATAAGVITVASTADIYPGANGSCLITASGIATEVVVVDILSATTFRVRVAPSVSQPIDGYPHGPHYGFNSMAAYNAGSVFTQYRTTVPVDDAHTKFNAAP